MFYAIEAAVAADNSGVAERFLKRAQRWIVPYLRLCIVCVMLVLPYHYHARLG